MKDRHDWIVLALGETPVKARQAIDVYFLEDGGGIVLTDDEELKKVAEKTDDFLGFLLREGFVIVKDDKSRGA